MNKRKQWTDSPETQSLCQYCQVARFNKVYYIFAGRETEEFIDVTDLVLMTRTLAVFRQRCQSLVDQSNVDFGDVQAEQAETTGCAATDAVEKLQRLADNVVVGLVTLSSQVILLPHRKHKT